MSPPTPALGYPIYSAQSLPKETRLALLRVLIIDKDPCVMTWQDSYIHRLLTPQRHALSKHPDPRADISKATFDMPDAFCIAIEKLCHLSEHTTVSAFRNAVRKHENVQLRDAVDRAVEALLSASMHVDPNDDFGEVTLGRRVTRDVPRPADTVRQREMDRRDAEREWRGEALGEMPGHSTRESSGDSDGDGEHNDVATDYAGLEIATDDGGVTLCMNKGKGNMGTLNTSANRRPDHVLGSLYEEPNNQLFDHFSTENADSDDSAPAEYANGTQLAHNGASALDEVIKNGYATMKQDTSIMNMVKPQISVERVKVVIDGAESVLDASDFIPEYETSELATLWGQTESDDITPPEPAETSDNAIDDAVVDTAEDDYDVEDSGDDESVDMEEVSADLSDPNDNFHLQTADEPRESTFDFLQRAKTSNSFSNLLRSDLTAIMLQELSKYMVVWMKNLDTAERSRDLIVKQFKENNKGDEFSQYGFSHVCDSFQDWTDEEVRAVFEKMYDAESLMRKTAGPIDNFSAFLREVDGCRVD